MAISATKLLLIESDPADAALIKDALRSEDAVFQLVWVTSLTEALEHLASNPVEVILLDLALPDGTGLEVFDKDQESAADHLLADRATPAHLPKALAPDGHLPTAMGRDDGPPVNHGSNLGHGEMPPAPLGQACEIGGRCTQGRGSWAIAASCPPMAGATIPYKVLLPCAHRRSWYGWWRLCGHQCHPHE